MNAVGRNDPCPCGIGRKFKQCCLNKTVSRKSYLPGEHDSALTKLLRFSEREEFKEARTGSLLLFWGNWLLRKRDKELERVMDSEQMNVAYHSWFLYDFDLDEGRTVLDLFLEREARKLSEGERNFLEGIRGSHTRLYEILDVKPEQGFELRDLWN